jgi:hypothetical protein
MLADALLCLAIVFSPCLLLVEGYVSVGIDDLRKDVVSLVELLFEKGYSADQIFNIMRFYCSS